MAKLVVTGQTKLNGTVKISGAKNAILPVLAASWLAESPVLIEEACDLQDVRTICGVINGLGVEITKQNNGDLLIDPSNLDCWEAPDALVRKMRVSILVMGPLLARLKKAKVAMPGGCEIGSRPIDLHLKGFRALGAEVTLENGFVVAKAEQLHGEKIYLDFPSVGATENIMMAAVLACGTTVIENAAEEPEIVDLANFLNSMGSRVMGAGTNIIRIRGVDRLHGSSYEVIPDRIEAGTYMVAAAACGGKVVIDNVLSDHVKPVIAKLSEAGVQIEEDYSSITVTSDGLLQAVNVKTMPYPGFPTDMQAQMVSLLATSKGSCVVTENVFENRFTYTSELKRMGAEIFIEDRNAVVNGVELLHGSEVHATDLRAGAALVIAGLKAHGETVIYNAYHLDRGYVDITSKFAGLGASVLRVEE